MNEDLRKWFREKWVRMDTKGNIKGDCAREEGEGKPKCLPLAKASSMSKEKRAVAARRKRREDPVADRSGKGEKPVNVATEEMSTSELIKKSHEKRGSPGTLKAKIDGPITLEKVRQLKSRPNATTLDKKQANFYINMHSEEYLEEKNAPTNPELWSKAKTLAKQKFDVYPSAYANGWAAKWYKSKGGSWKSLSEGMQMKTTRTAQEKFKAGLKKSGYDPDAGAKRLLDLIAKQKKEREEFESKNKSTKEGKEMKTLEQIVEGIVVSSDFKVGKTGRKYKAHRVKMGRDVDMANEAKDPREYDYEGDMAKSQLRSIMVNAKQVHDMLKDDTNMAEWVQSKITLAADYVSTVADYMQAEVNEDIEQVDEEKIVAVIDGVRSDRKYNDADHAHNSLSKLVAYQKAKKAELYVDGKKTKHYELNKKYDDFAPKKLSEESIDQIDELKKATVQSYLKKKTTTPGVPSQKDVSGMARASMRLMGKGPMSEDANFDELDEARGRPAGAATLAKRAVAAAAAKPRHDDDEGDQYDPDSGVEADQHIHVQLKKASDSDQKPFEVSFKNGKKHAVSQKVAKDILGATDRLKPEHRKNVHDEIHQSYDNLMSVHRLIAGR